MGEANRKAGGEMMDHLRVAVKEIGEGNNRGVVGG